MFKNIFANFLLHFLVFYEPSAARSPELEQGKGVARDEIGDGRKGKLRGFLAERGPELSRPWPPSTWQCRGRAGLIIFLQSQ